MINRLMDNLHPAINKDPLQTNAISIIGSGTVVIKDNIMQLIGTSSAQYDLRSYTLGTLTAAINAVAGFSATCLTLPSLSALVLLQNTYTVSGALPMFTSFLWQLLKAVAVEMLNALGAENNAIQEMILNTSDGAWLDAFGELFGVTRELGEIDQLFAIRIFDLSVGARVNNLAIQKALQDLQYASVITDAGGSTFTVTTTIPTNPPLGFVYTTAQIRNLIDALRPAGVSYTMISQGTFGDGFTISDVLSYLTSTGPVKYGTGRLRGRGIWAN